MYAPSSTSRLRALPPMTRLLHELTRLVWDWETRRTTRMDLLDMPEYLLRDIGLTREAAEAEAAKPFWER